MDELTNIIIIPLFRRDDLDDTSDVLFQLTVCCLANENFTKHIYIECIISKILLG